ncbi:MAG: hypothetical protein AB7V43_03410 [Acidimicrobiia bacterium]
MTEPTSPAPTPDPEKPTLRQKLHWATGDRDAEAKALADRSTSEIDEDDAQLAVRRAHGEIRDGAQDTVDGSDIASTEDAEHAAKDRQD